jgi:hypothetical protein
MRMSSAFCPEAATSSRALAIHCLTTNRSNTMCLYHHKLDKAQRVSDEALAKPDAAKTDAEEGDGGDAEKDVDSGTKPIKSKFQVTGVPYMRRVTAGGALVSLSAGILHCGCCEDEALLDFWWFKTGEITSAFSGVTEGWLTDVLAPRPRALLSKSFCGISGLTIDDLYTTDASGNPRSVESRLNLQITRLQARAHVLKEAREVAEAAAAMVIDLI